MARLPPPSLPIRGGGASAVVRTDESSEKQSFSTRRQTGASSSFRRPSPSDPPAVCSLCGGAGVWEGGGPGWGGQSRGSETTVHACTHVGRGRSGVPRGLSAALQALGPLSSLPRQPEEHVTQVPRQTPATDAPATPGRLKVNRVELWSSIQVMTDFSSSGVTDLLVPSALSLSIRPTETKNNRPRTLKHPVSGLGPQPSSWGPAPGEGSGSPPCQGSRTFLLHRELQVSFYGCQSNCVTPLLQIFR